LSDEQLHRINRYWAAANYLTVGQIYLQDNPLLREPLRPEHIKPRLLGHWGTSPGLSLIYAHLNPLIVEHQANVIYLAGPGHGGPAIVANVYDDQPIWGPAPGELHGSSHKPLIEHPSLCGGRQCESTQEQRQHWIGRPA